MLNTGVVLVIHDVRSTHNVGSMLRTAEGLGVKRVYLTGYTPYPELASDERLPHLKTKLTRQINKTALGAENYLDIRHSDLLSSAVRELKGGGYAIIGIEQAQNSRPLNEFTPLTKIALLVGNEVDGLDKTALKLCDEILEIPMLGKKESFNVAQSAAMALYHIRFGA